MRKQGGMVLVAALALAASPAPADENLNASLRGFEEVPVISTTGEGHFMARMGKDKNGPKIDWELSYADLEGSVQQAHIHFGQPAVNGGIAVFLCSNLGNGPAGTQRCPPAPATVTGTIRAGDVIGPAGQGITAGELAELIKAIRGGVTYANVHSDKWPGGEIRGLLRDEEHDEHDEHDH
jgi:CHRD domain-containing protein